MTVAQQKARRIMESFENPFRMVAPPDLWRARPFLPSFLFLAGCFLVFV